MNEEPFIARASLAGYIVLSGIWFVLAASYVWLAIDRHCSSCWQAVIICAVVGTFFVVWLRGFRLQIDGDQLMYRNGLYRLHRGLISQIKGDHTQHSEHLRPEWR